MVPVVLRVPRRLAPRALGIPRLLPTRVPSVPHVVLLVLIGLFVLAVPAAAHPVPLAHLDLRLAATAAQPITGTVTVHVFDASHELAIDPPERLLVPPVTPAQVAALEALEKMLTRRLSLDADGRPLAIAW